jgi:transcriptional regulator with XRE-family HTH domain
MIGDAVRAARETTGQSQSQVAAKAGTSQNQIWRLESGSMKRGPSFDVLNRIANACNARLTLEIK